MRNDFNQFFQLMCPTLLDEEKLSLPYEREETNDSDFSGRVVEPAQTDKPPVEGDPRYVARRNRRLRNKYRNIQIFDNKKKAWVDSNTRYTRFKDANASIEKFNYPATKDGWD